MEAVSVVEYAAPSSAPGGFKRGGEDTSPAAVGGAYDPYFHHDSDYTADSYDGAGAASGAGAEVAVDQYCVPLPSGLTPRRKLKKSSKC